MDNERFQNLVLDHMAKLTQEITEIKGEINGIKQEIKKINFKLENEIEPKIVALFEGQQLNSAQLKRIEEKVSQHEEFIIKRIK